MSILIVGSQGFIGSNLYKYFNGQCTGCDIVEMIKQDSFAKISTFEEIESLILKTKPDIVINCSGAADVQSSLTNPLRDFELNTQNVAKLLSYIKTHVPNGKFINLSSAAVYGNPKKFPVTEASQIAPLSPYGYHKYLAEQIAHEFHSIFGIKSLNLRIFSCYGPGIRKQLLWDTYQKSLAGSNIIMHGTGLETRDFIHVSDLCRVVDILIKKHEFDGSSINVANGIESTVKEVCDILIKKLEWKGKLSFNMITREGDPTNWRADISKLETLGYRPSIGLEHGISTYVEWLNNLF